MNVSTQHRAVILGGGAVGAHLAASFRPGVKLLVVDPDPRVRAAFESRGVGAVAPAAKQDGGDGVADFFEPGDVAIVATSAARAVEVVGGVPGTVPVICVSNGLNAGLDAERAGGLEIGVVEFAVSSVSPGVAVRTRAGWLTMGCGSRASAWLAAALDPARQTARVVDDLASHQHAKLMLNASLDPVAAVMGGTLGDVFGSRGGFGAFSALLGEALDVARASRWRLAAVQGMTPWGMRRVFRTPLLGRLAAHIAGRQARAVESTLAREIARGDLSEADQLCGAIVRQGMAVSVATPAHARALAVLGRLSAQRVRGSPEGVRELVGGSLS